MRHTSHDPVTGLPGLALIRDRLANALQRSRRNGLSLVVLFVDLDGFNLVKDTDGQDVGDPLLKQVAGRLAEQIRPGIPWRVLPGKSLSSSASRSNNRPRCPFWPIASTRLCVSHWRATGGNGSSRRASGSPLGTAIPIASTIC